LPTYPGNKVDRQEPATESWLEQLKSCPHSGGITCETSNSMTKHSARNPQSVASSETSTRDSARARISGVPNELVPLDLPGRDCEEVESSVARDRILRSKSRTAGRKAGAQQKRNQIPDLDFQFGMMPGSPVVRDNCVIAALAGAADILDRQRRSVKGWLDGPEPTWTGARSSILK
jgi:hypothetical protein